jgi:crotonobetaine/carnitine-CoA ligase
MVPVNTRYQTADAAHVLRTSAAAGIVAAAEFEPLLRRLPPDVPALRHLHLASAIEAGAAELSAARPAPGQEPWLSAEPGPADTANIQFTSGTTGSPKGCVLPHRYWTQLAAGLVTEFPYLSDRDVLLTAQPFHYIDPQWNVAAGLLSGARLVVLDGFHPSSFWAKVRQHRVTYFYCLGAMPTLLLRMPADPLDREHDVRVVECSAIPPAPHPPREARGPAPRAGAALGRGLA